MAQGENAARLSATGVDFGAVAVGTTAAAKTVTSHQLRHDGRRRSPIQIADATFAVAGGTYAKGLVLAVNDQCTVQVTFTPAQAARRGPLTRDVGRTTAQANLTGTGETARSARVADQPRLRIGGR